MYICFGVVTDFHLYLKKAGISFKCLLLNLESCIGRLFGESILT